jgi:hypothetical protein
MAIRAAALIIGIAPLVVFLNAVNALPGLALAAVAAYSVAGGAYFANYGLTHPDEIPGSPARRRDHHV